MLSPETGSLAAGEEITDVLQVAVPANWAGMQSTTYRFKLSASSEGEPTVGDTDLAFLNMQATKRSKIQYALLEISWLRAEVSTLAPRNMSGLLAKLYAADAKVQVALDGLLAGDLIRANTSLDAAINKLEAFVKSFEAQRGRQPDPETAAQLIAEANAVIAHLVDARTTQLE